MQIDLNCDLGEGFGTWSIADDDALLQVTTSANIACGFHAGDPSIIRRTCESAVANGVRIGAHVGHRDLFGFGRRAIGVAPTTLSDETLYQLGALSAFASAAGGTVRYVKPHGALYHQVADDRHLADAVVTAIAEFDTTLAIMGPAGSALHSAAKAANLRFEREGFADRRYLSSGALTPRGTAGAVLKVDAAVDQVHQIVTTGQVRTADGELIAVPADTICVHGDSPDAVAVLTRLRHLLASDN